MPTTYVRLWSGLKLDPLKDPDSARKRNIQLEAGTYSAGELLGELTATPGKFGTYATGAVDGKGVAKLVNEYPCVVDANGIWLGDTAGSAEFGPLTHISAYVNGLFSAADLVGLDADALVDLQARIVKGTITDGEILIPG